MLYAINSGINNFKFFNSPLGHHKHNVAQKVKKLDFSRIIVVMIKHKLTLMYRLEVQKTLVVGAVLLFMSVYVGGCTQGSGNGASFWRLRESGGQPTP